MNIETLRIFCDVAEHQSFSHAASINKVTQSSVTQSVHRLEKRIGTSLIDRTKRPFLLTDEGQLCSEGFREILKRYDTILSDIQSRCGCFSGIIRVAAIYSVGLHVMNRCMSDFMKAFPKTKVRLEFLHPHKVYQAVKDADVDFGIIAYPVPTVDLHMIPLPVEPMALVCSPNHPLAEKEAVSLKELKGLDYIAFEKDLVVRKEIDHHLEEFGAAVNIVMEFNNIETIKQAIESGLGVGILPTPAVQNEVENGSLLAIPITSPKMVRPIGIIHKQHKVFSPAMKKFIEMLTELQYPK